MPRPAEVSARHVDGGFDFLVAPLAHPRHRRPAPSARDPSAPQPAPFARSDLLLNSTQWSSQVVGKTSPWIDADSASAPSRRDGEAALRQELMWAAHLVSARRAPAHALVLRGELRARGEPVPLRAVQHRAVGARARGGAGGGGGGGARRQRNVGIDDASRSVRGVGQLPGAVRGPPAARRVPGRGRGVAHGRGDRPVGGRTRARGGHRAERVRRQQARLPGVAQAPPGVRPADDAQEAWSGLRGGGGDTSGDGENEGGDTSGSAGAVDEHTADARSGGGDAAPTPAETARMASDAAARPENAHPARRRWEYVVYLFRKIEPTTEQELQEAGYRDSPAGAAAASDGQPGVRDVRDVREGRLEVHPVRRGCAGVPRRPRVGRRRRGRAGHRAGGGWRRSRALVRASLRASERSGRAVRVYAVEKNPNAVITLQSLVEF